ncbi:outer membrane protein [Pedobacter frigoris]|nr:outer membrane beta-barrel protein [Pedobacter frigoris]
MKKQLFTAAAVLLSVCGYAQTKGTSALGLGVNTSTSKYVTAENGVISENTNKISSFNLNYGFFIKDNTKLSVDFSYGQSKQGLVENDNYNEAKIYGIGLSYQQYFPLTGKFYAFAGGRGSYGKSKQEYLNNATDRPEITGDAFGLNAIGGLSWFVSRHWALETTLLSAGANYTKQSQTAVSGSSASYKNTSFDLKSGGLFDELGFKVYFMF